MAWIPSWRSIKSCSDLGNTCKSLTVISDGAPCPLWLSAFPILSHFFYWSLGPYFRLLMSLTWRHEARTLRIGARCFSASARSQHQEFGSSEDRSRISKKSVISSLLLWSSWRELLQTWSLSILELDTEGKFSKARLKWSWRTGLKYWRRDFT